MYDKSINLILKRLPSIYTASKLVNSHPVCHAVYSMCRFSPLFCCSQLSYQSILHHNSDLGNNNLV